MFISEEEMNRRLKSDKNLANKLSDPTGKHLPKHKTTPSINIPPAPRYIPGSVVPDLPDFRDASSQGQPKSNKVINIGVKMACSLIAQGVPMDVVSSELGVPVADIKAASGDPQVRSSVEHTMDRIKELALDKLMLSLGLMTQDKFENATLKELATTTAALSRVVEQANAATAESGASFHLHVYAPEVRKVEQYKVIDV